MLIRPVKKAPFAAVDDEKGKPVDLAERLKGKVVLLNFWATWCAPCIAEIPDLIRLQEKYAGQFLVVGLSTDIDPPSKVKEFARQKGINYPVAMAGPEVEAKFGGVFGLPTSFVLDTEGRIVQKHIGLLDPANYELEIRALLNLPVNARVERFEDTGQVMLANASKALEYPGVDLSKLNEQQKVAARRRINETECNCGCGLTVAQCLVHDTSCATSKQLAAGIVEKLRTGAPSLAPEGANP